MAVLGDPMAFRLVKCGDARRRGLLADWEAWLRQADKLYMRLLDRIGDPPFLYHEVASVGFLASAAAMAGFTPLAEYEVIKRGRQDKRARVDGRADFWFASKGDRCYSFEFKRAYFAATADNLGRTLDAAYDDIECIPRNEYHYAAACAVGLVTEEHRLAVYEEFAEGANVDYAYRIGPVGVNGAYLYFRLKKEKR